MLARKTTASLTTIVGRRVRFTTLSPPLYRSLCLKESFLVVPFRGKLLGNDREIFSLSFSLSRLSRIRDERDDFTRNTHTERKGERKSSI